MNSTKQVDTRVVTEPRSYTDFNGWRKVLPALPQPMPEPEQVTAQPQAFGLSGWLLLIAAFLFVLMLALLGVAFSNAALLWLSLALAVGSASASATYYYTRRASAPTARKETPNPISLSALAQDQFALTSGLEGMSEGLLLAHMDGRLIYANKRAEELLKWCRVYEEGQRFNTVEEWLARIRPYISNRDTFKMAMLAARQYSGQGQVPSFEFSLDRPPEVEKSSIEQPLRPTPFINQSGEIGRDPTGDLASRPARDFRLTLFPIDDASGRQVGTGYLLRDVTRDRELDRLKDQFVSMVSHELRNPIAVILSMTEILQDDKLPPEERHNWINQINSEAMRLRAMLNDMLDLSRLEEGKLELLMANVDLRSAIQKVVDQCKVQETTPHEIVLDIEVQDPLVRADSGKLLQVLANLIGNAVKYSPKGGQIKIGVRDVANSDEDAGTDGKHFYEISVADQGMGIPEKEQAKIFSRFYRSSISKRSSISGTGLGLSITQRLVKMMGGNIWFTSKEGQGSTFYFSLPAAQKRQ